MIWMNSEHWVWPSALFLFNLPEGAYWNTTHNSHSLPVHFTLQVTLWRWTFEILPQKTLKLAKPNRHTTHAYSKWTMMHTFIHHTDEVFTADTPFKYSEYRAVTLNVIHLRFLSPTHSFYYVILSNLLKGVSPECLVIPSALHLCAVSPLYVIQYVLHHGLKFHNMKIIRARCDGTDRVANSVCPFRCYYMVRILFKILL